jgi:hypothetical protein
VQAIVAAGQKSKIEIILRTTREVIVDILHGAAGGIESAGLIFGSDV